MPILRRPLIAAAVCLLPLTIVTPAIADEPAPVHVRPLSEDARDLVHSGAVRSESIRTLIDRLEASDLVAYVEIRWFMGDRGGQLKFIGTAGGLRYVMIQIACGHLMLDQIATLGHELRHAVEVADATAVVDPASFARLYARIGIDVGRIGSTRQYETDAAVHAGRLVKRELAAPVASSKVDP